MTKKSLKDSIGKLQERIDKKTEKIKAESAQRSALKKKLENARTTYYKAWMDDLTRRIVACSSDELDIDAVSPKDVLEFMKSKNPAQNTENKPEGDNAQSGQDGQNKENEDKQQDGEKKPAEGEKHEQGENKDENQNNDNNGNGNNTENNENHNNGENGQQDDKKDARWTPPQAF